MAVAITKTILSTIVLGAILGTVISGIILWRRAKGYNGCGRIHKCHNRFGNPPDDHEDLEASRGSSSSPSRVHDHHDPSNFAAHENALGSDVNDSDSSESFIYGPEPYSSGLYQQYPLREAHSYMHNTSRGNRSLNLNSKGPVSHRGLERVPSDFSTDSDPYTSDLYDDDHEADSESSLSFPPTPSDVSSSSDSSYTSDLYGDGYEADSDSMTSFLSCPPTPSDRAPLLQNTRRGPRYS